MDGSLAPRSAEHFHFAEFGITALSWTQQDRVALAILKGARQRLVEQRVFADAAQRDAYLADVVRRERDWARQKRESLYARLHARHGLVVGDIVCCICGPKRNSVNFYEVIRVPSESTAAIRQLEIERHETAPGSMVGSARPKPGCFKREARPVNCRASGLHTLGTSKSWRGILGKWEGEPVPVDWRDEQRLRDDGWRARRGEILGYSAA